MKLRGALTDHGFKGQFSGHETFPLRHLWLKKAYDEVAKTESGASKSLFSEDKAIVTFGVGKNMVSAIRHWALTCEVIKEDGEVYRPTRLGRLIFDDEEGLDPYLETPATNWLLQWMIAGRPERSTTWYYAFNHLAPQVFDHDAVATPIGELCHARGWTRASAATIKRDVECFLRSYVPATSKKFTDDSMEPVLAQLGLIRAVSSKSFEFRRGPKPSLPDGVFLFALTEFWRRHAIDQNTLSVESIAYESGSPGRVFKIDEASLTDRLARIGESSNNAFIWSDTAGVRNVARRKPDVDPIMFLPSAYSSSSERRVA
ncbi:DUF4007 family protein [Pelagibius sp. Alg239-R121]|uniref:DUF4007 family protein n=1 Tax=Pelagibius sp. Alg239-R121 TaxID=2993448 RepID=UPI0024A66FD9|nr:DUF4007 family protein [Pelagibius sp. Alg239-R121]